MLKSLQEIAREISFPESEVLNLAAYSGLRRVRGGLYDEREFLLAVIKQMAEERYGCAAVEKAALKVRAVVDPPPKPVPRFRTCLRGRKCKTAWNGSLQRKKESAPRAVEGSTIAGK